MREMTTGIRPSRLNRSGVMNVMKIGGKKKSAPFLYSTFTIAPSQSLPHPVDFVSLISIQWIH